MRRISSRSENARRTSSPCAPAACTARSVCDDEAAASRAVLERRAALSRAPLLRPACTLNRMGEHPDKPDELLGDVDEIAISRLLEDIAPIEAPNLQLRILVHDEDGPNPGELRRSWGPRSSRKQNGAVHIEIRLDLPAKGVDLRRLPPRQFLRRRHVITDVVIVRMSLRGIGHPRHEAGVYCAGGVMPADVRGRREARPDRSTVECRDERRRRWKPRGWVLREQRHHDTRKLRRSLGTELLNRRRLRMEVLDENCRTAVPSERRLAGEHLVGHDAERIEITAPVDLGIAAGLFGGHVLRRSDNLARSPSGAWIHRPSRARFRSP